jgi:polar amino acid transport system ATP-binding protein
MITVERLSKAYGDHRVLDAVDHRQAHSESVVLIGPSGCGKSTFLRCLNQLETPDSGRVTIDDVTVDCAGPVDRELQRQLCLRAGMVFQQFHLFPHRTALENILEGPVHVLGRTRSEVEPEALQLLARVGLSDRAGHRPSQLSCGQQQRVAIARALAMKPRALLLDEPTSALDPELREEVRDVLRRLADEGMTMLLVTHDLQLARDVSDRILFFHGGRIVESGPPGEVLDRPQHPRTREFLGQSLRGMSPGAS